MSIAASADCFHSEEAAHALLENLLWPAGPVCPHCGQVGRAYKIEASPKRRIRHGLWSCARPGCRRQFTVTLGTLFEASKLPLQKWLRAIYLLHCAPAGFGPWQLGHILGVNYRTARSIQERLYLADAERTDPAVPVDDDGIDLPPWSTGRLDPDAILPPLAGPLAFARLLDAGLDA